jgi:hypothetical protein
VARLHLDARRLEGIVSLTDVMSVYGFGNSDAASSDA